MNGRAVLRDVAVIFGLMLLAAALVGAFTASWEPEDRLPLLAVTNLAAVTLGFFLSGLRPIERRVRHQIVVVAVLWLINAIGILGGDQSFLLWLLGGAVLLAMSFVGTGLAEVVVGTRKPPPATTRVSGPSGGPSSALASEVGVAAKAIAPDAEHALELHPFDAFRGRLVVLWGFGVLAFDLMLFPLYGEGPLGTAISGMVFSVMLAAAPLAWAVRAGVLRRPGLLGAPVTPRQLGRAAWLALPVVGVSLLSLYALHAPLSWLAPEFLAGWKELTSFEILFTEGRGYMAANLIYFLMIVVVAPITEELLFRGLLFSRWSRKWGPRAGAVLTGVAFALLHGEPLGAFVFSILMTELYARSRSLVLPMVVHGVHNLLVWLTELLAQMGWWPAGWNMAAVSFDSWWLPALGVACIVPALPEVWRAGRPRFEAPPLG